MLIKTGTKWKAARAFLNLWLKDKSLYCNWCGKTYNEKEFPCCEQPQVGSNLDHTRGIIRQNQAFRNSRNNDTATTKDKSLRWGVSMPPALMTALEKYFMKEYNEKLFKNVEELHQFMREFPVFRIPKKV